MERLELIKTDKGSKVYSRKTAKIALENVKKKIKEINSNNEFIYKVTKVVLFGSYINSKKEKIGDLDIAVYLKLKDLSKPEYMQNCIRARKSSKYVPFIFESVYGKEEVFKYIKDRKKVIQLHDGIMVDKDAQYHNEPISYIYFDKYDVIYEEIQ